MKTDMTTNLSSERARCSQLVPTAPPLKKWLTEDSFLQGIVKISASNNMQVIILLNDPRKYTHDQNQQRGKTVIQDLNSTHLNSHHTINI